MNAPTSTLTLLHASTPAGVALADAVTRSLARSPSWYELHRAPLEELAERPWPAEAPAEPDEPRRGLHGNLLLDTDLGLSVRALLRMDTSERARTSVVTDLQHPLALDVLASRHIAHVASLEAVDESATTSARLLHVALTGMFEQRGYQWSSGATYTELLALGRLAAGLDTFGIAKELCLSVKTVEAHLANVRGKHGLEADRDLLEVLNARGPHATTSDLGRAHALAFGTNRA
jgi:DNA-binding CsgD family transcriptional regulator